MKKTIVALGAVLAWTVAVFAATHDGVQLWENGPLWAKTNVGANSPTETGYYFWWGDTVGYKWQNNQWVASDGSKSGFNFEPVDIPTNGKSFAQLQSMGIVNADGNLQPAYDAAAQQWGDDWRMPKVSELNNLRDLCSWNWTTNNGVVGYTVTGKGLYSGNSVFFPAAGWGIGASINDLSVYGCYRSSTVGKSNSMADRLCFTKTQYGVDELYVSWGYPIRPVKSLIAAKQSSAAALDTRTGTRTVAAKESIAYDAAWGDATSGTLTVNGTAVSGLSKTGTYAWTPNTSQTNYWKLAYKAGTANYAATFQSLDKYTITYAETKGAANTNPTQYNILDSITFAALPNVTGYTFKGWNPTKIAAGGFGAKTVTAQWTPITFTVKFNANGGTGTMANESFTYDTAKALTANAFTRTGYTFKGWATSSGATSAAYTDKQSVKNLTATAGATVNLYAVWQVNTYSVKFNANGGSGSMTALGCTYGQNATLTANAFTRTGYAFLGWATSASGAVVYRNGVSVKNLSDAANATINLYAKWTDTWYVNAATGNDANEGASAADAFKTIQHAIDLTVPGMTIVVADGTYAPINSGNKSITIQSVNGAAKTIIDGGYPAVTNRCVFAGGNDGQTNTVIRGFTIQNGCTIGLASLNGAGVAGGTLHNCIVRANHGGQVGGGVAHSLMFECEISDNETENGGGGAYRAYLNNCQLLSNRCKNEGAGAYGGILNDCTIASNRAELAGGGVCNAVLTNCVVRDNVAISNGGGAYSGSLYGCTITNNIAYQYGGGVSGTRVENCILSGNEAYVSGGGAYLATCTGSEIRGNKATQDAGGTYNCTVVNCVLADNESGAHGGGVLKGNLENCLVYGNRARTGSGGGVAQAISVNCTIYGNNAAVNGGGATMGTNYNCIVYGNVASAGKEINVGGLVGSVVNCCTDDPHFIRAEAGDFRLRCDSPCIDAGDKTYVTNTVDFAGNPRVVNNKVDIGAYEFSAALDRHFSVEVTNGTGGAIYYEGDTVTITAEDRSPRYTFTRWTGDVSVLKNVNGMTNTFTMPTRNLAFTAEYDDLQQYLVIDLSGGVNATSYPVSYLTDVPAGGWTDTYKTTKLVMRRIDPGTFTMGSPEGEAGRHSGETQHQVTLKHPYYIGVFELTQRQWELVMGTRPSAFSNSVCYATRPVERVSYNQIRGADLGKWWPQMNTVDETSFMGKLRAKTGRLFDLPTEAQWEFACRAGTTTALNSGKNLVAVSGVDANLAEVGRYYYNSGVYNSSYDFSSTDEKGTAKVGSYLPNMWGLYDMHGNIGEYCLDWYCMDNTSELDDPVGSETGTSRSVRCGTWGDYAHWCRSASRGLINIYTSSASDRVGLRPVINFADFSMKKVVNVQASDGTVPEGIRVTWTAVPGTEKYRIYKGLTSNIDNATIVGESTTVEYLSVQPTTDTYWFWVQAKVDGVWGDVSEGDTGYRIRYQLTVTGGSGSTNCFGNTSVTIKANVAPTGYTFKEWTGSAADVALLASKTAATTTLTMPGRAVTLTATYQPNAYAVKFNANGGTGTMANESFVYDTAKALTANAFTRTGYTFKGWATTASGAVAHADKASVKNLTASAGQVIDLFAVWEIKRHSVTINSAWGEGSSATYDYGSTVTLSAPNEVIDAKGTTKYVCLGSSAYPEAGTNVTLTVTGNVDFAWDVWQTNYWVSATVEGPGAIQENGLVFENGWRAQDDELVLTAVPEESAKFFGWSGDLDEDDVVEGAVLAFTVLEPRAIGVSFGQTSYKEELNAEKMGDFATDVAEDWVIVMDPTAKYAGTSVKSAVEEDYSEEPQESVLRSTVRGPGTFSFWWRSSCDEDPAGEYTWDHGELRVDGEVVACIDGITDWRQVSVDIVGEGVHTIEWVYAMDGFPSELEGTEDCIWIDAVNWTGANAELPLVAPVITPGNGSVFETPTCTVTITCESPRAIIYYSTNGRTPSLTDRYTGPFTIDKTTTVTAVSVRDEEKSAYVKAVITQEIPLKHYTIAYAANGGTGTMTATACTEDVSVTLPECAFTRQGYAFVGWALEATAQLESVVYHPGDVVTNLTTEDGATVTLYAVWTYLPLVDPVIAPADGTTFAETCSVTITCESADAVIYYSTTGRTPSLTETYRYKGPFTIDKTTTVTAVVVRGEEKSAYVKVVISKQSATQTTEVPVPFAWLHEKYPTLNDVAAFEAKANEMAANGINTVWECYVAGLDPTNPTSLFQSKISFVDGKIVIEWTPYLNESATSRIYTVYGRKGLKEGDWETPIKSSHKFFKVKVSLPTGAEGEESAKPGVGFVPKGPGHESVQLWENGPYWATTNIGADEPEDFGYYFWWGDTIGYRPDLSSAIGSGYWPNVKWISSSGESMNSVTIFGSEFVPTYDKSLDELQQLGYVDASGNLSAKYDAATQHWGAGWRMPTYADFASLLKNCETQWITKGTVNGLLVTGRGDFASKSVFFPFTGYGYTSDLEMELHFAEYWTSSSGWDGYYGQTFHIRKCCLDVDVRFYGFPIRPVRDALQ